jgi:hypothetical protein
MNKTAFFSAVALSSLAFACASGDDPGIDAVGADATMEPNGTASPSASGTTPAAPGSSPPAAMPTSTAVTPVPAVPAMEGCSNTADMTLVPIDATGWVARECTDYFIQGAWYCYDDGINESGCTMGTPPYDAASAGMCLTGVTTVDATFAAWGAGIGLALNDSGTEGGMTSVKSSYDAMANGYNGVHLVITGDTGGLGLRVNFSVSADTTGTISPFWAVPGPGTYDIKIADAVVPEAWMAPESGTTGNPAAVYDVQVQVAGGETAANYNFCITELKLVNLP